MNHLVSTPNFLNRPLLIALIFVSIRSVTAQEGATANDLDANEIARRMIRSNGLITSIEADFSVDQHVPSTPANIERTESEFKWLLEQAKRDDTIQATEGFRDRIMEQYASGEFVEYIHRFSGIVESGNQFRLRYFRRKPYDSEEYTVQIFNGEDGLSYDPRRKEARLESAQNRMSPVAQNRSRVWKIKGWMSRINQIASAEKVSIVGKTIVDGHAAILLKQEPTDWSLNLATLYYTVVPDFGYNAVDTKFVDVESGEIVRHIVAENFEEIRPGIFRPTRLTDDRFEISENGAALSSRQVITIDAVHEINREYPDSIFAPIVPKEAKTIVELGTGGLPVSFEIEPLDVSSLDIDLSQPLIRSEEPRSEEGSDTPSVLDSNAVVILIDQEESVPIDPRLKLLLVVLIPGAALLTVLAWRRRT